MTVQAVIVHVLEHSYEHPLNLAESTALPLKTFFLHELKKVFLLQLPLDEKAKLNAFNHLADEALSIIVCEQIPADRQKYEKVYNW